MKITGNFSSVWDVDGKGRGYVITTNCIIDLKTGEVDAETCSDEETSMVEILDREYVEVDGCEFAVKDGKVVKLGDLSSMVNKKSL